MWVPTYIYMAGHLLFGAFVIAYLVRLLGIPQHLSKWLAPSTLRRPYRPQTDD